MKRIKNALFVSFCLLVTLLIFNGCADNVGMPSAPGEEPAITLQKVAGLELYCNGRIVAIIDSTGITGGVCAKMNQNSNIFEVEFLNEQGEVINDDPELYKLAWKSDTQYANFESYSDWEFCIFGTKTGKTDFQLLLNSCGSNCYTSPAIPLEIR